MSLRVLILGGDGYLGWPTALAFSRKGHGVGRLDHFLKRRWELEAGIRPLFPIGTLQERVRRWHAVSGIDLEAWIGDLANYGFVESVIEWVRLEAVIHSRERPSAPASMIAFRRATTTVANSAMGAAHGRDEWQAVGHAGRRGSMSGPSRGVDLDDAGSWFCS